MWRTDLGNGFKVIPYFRSRRLIETLDQVEIPVLKDPICNCACTNWSLAFVAAGCIFEHFIIERLYSKAQAGNALSLERPQLVFPLRRGDCEGTAFDAKLCVGSQIIFISNGTYQTVQRWLIENERRASADID
ncbi:hypothetical protein LMTR13_27455 [Bradyrhizobium icense]|uniref:Uncharacterized protein n=1 Tax=Bradyrhizobium icense TaxID=1274631 RepID=A0A1B1UKN1_9BRAD|nr:hypothetical protein LMTR13_27455 [Bradyrhizobium icense]